MVDVLKAGALLLFAGPSMEALALEPFAMWSSPQFQAEMRSSGLPAERVEDIAQQSQSLQEMMRIVYPAAFLIGGGILARLAATGDPASGAYLRAAAAVHTLLSPAEMGELVKVLALARSSAIAWPGFTLADRSHRL